MIENFQNSYTEAVAPESVAVELVDLGIPFECL